MFGEIKNLGRSLNFSYDSCWEYENIELSCQTLHVCHRFPKKGAILKENIRSEIFKMQLVVVSISTSKIIDPCD